MADDGQGWQGDSEEHAEAAQGMSPSDDTMQSDNTQGVSDTEDLSSDEVNTEDNETAGGQAITEKIATAFAGSDAEEAGDDEPEVMENDEVDDEPEDDTEPMSTDESELADEDSAGEGSSLQGDQDSQPGSILNSKEEV